MALEDEDRAPDESRAEDVPPENASVDLRVECARLRQEVRRLGQERDEYHRQLCHLLGEYFNAVNGELTEEKLLALIANEKWLPFEDVLNELEGISREK